MLFKKLSVFGLLTLGGLAFAQTAYINQIGYRTGDVKELALVGGNDSPVEFVDASGNVAYSATPGAAKQYSAAGVSASLVDFTELDAAGTYQVRQGGNVLREDLKIGDKPYEEVMKAALKWYYYQRASMELTEEYAGQYKRAAGHMDQNVKLHSSTGESGTISSPKGWYDAGDYGKYIVNSGITTYTLLALYEHFPEYFKTAKWNIPAEGSLPDLLAEIKYNLDWMLTMQSKQDGGVYHKLTTLDFSGDVMPAADNASRYAIGKGTAASYDFAAVMAAAARIYKPFDEMFAATCLEAAKKAYDWASKNPNARFKNPSDVSTGEYGDSYFDDEKLFASAELFVTTGEASYKVSGATSEVPSWPGVGGLATYEKAIHPTEFANEGLDSLLSTANELEARTKVGFGVAMASKDFVWGSNAVAANQGIWLLHAYYMTGEKKYYNAAVKVVDYLLGKNPLNMSFVTGYGTKSPKKPHHRPSTADKISAPVPGMLVGGPQRNDNSDIGSQSWECSDYRTQYPATSYVDNNCSYATNEVAINWNAPLAYLVGAVEALNAGYVPEFSKLAPPTTGIAKVNAPANAASARRLVFDGHKVMMKIGDKTFNLNGTRVKVK